MTVVELWKAFDNWMPHTNVKVFECKTLQFNSFSYFDNVLNKYADCAVGSFCYNSATNEIIIEVI